MKLYKKAFKKVPLALTIAERKREVMQDLLKQERQTTDGLFGEVEEGRKRDFFCLDARTWVWYEEWREHGEHKTMTTHYHVRPEGLMKSRNSGALEAVEQQEAQHFIAAVKKYTQLVKNQLYS